MKATSTLTILVSFVLTCMAHALGDAIRTDEVERSIKEIFEKIKTSDEGRPFLNQVDADKIQFSHNPAFQDKGWIVEAWIQHGKVVYEANHHVQSSQVPNVESEDGIILDIFVASHHGDMMVSRTNSFDDPEHSGLIVGYYLRTRRDDPMLKQRIDQIIKDDISSGSGLSTSGK